MNRSTRREFLQTSAVLLGTALSGVSFEDKKRNPLLCFSTLGCPDWSFDKIVNFAVQHNYKGLEIRGLQRELDLVKCKEFSSAASITCTRKLMRDKGLQFVDLGSSANLHFADGAVRKKNLDEAKRFIDLAQQLNCPYIRVFPNNFLKDQDKNATMALIVSGLLQLAEYAKGSSVTVLMESHGDLVVTNDLEKIMQAAEHKHAGLIWDITNMWMVTKESPVMVYNKLKKYIRHVHVKDAKTTDGKLQYTLLGKGEVPVFEALDALSAGGYKGYYSFEWEKLWHPEIEDPEIALADYSSAMRKKWAL